MIKEIGDIDIIAFAAGSHVDRSIIIHGICIR